MEKSEIFNISVEFIALIISIFDNFAEKNRAIDMSYREVMF